MSNGDFFENLPLYKGKQKGKWKKHKNREKKVQLPQKNLPLILFWPHFLTHRPIFLTFWDFHLQINPITKNTLFLSDSFPFFIPTIYLFSHKIQPVFYPSKFPKQISCVEQHIKNRADDLWKLTTSSAQRLWVCFLQFGFCNF